MTSAKDYFFPKRKLHKIPRHISAMYTRNEISKEQSIIMMAGLARDPMEAQSVYEALRKEHGKDVWKHVQFEVRRKRLGTFSGRLMKLMRKIFGEREYQNYKRLNEESIVFMDYRFEEK